MIKVLKWGWKFQAPLHVKCGRCETEMMVSGEDWRKGTYGSEEVINCPCCKGELVRPNTEYRGDF